MSNNARPPAQFPYISPNTQLALDGEVSKSGCPVLCLVAFFRGGGSLNDPHWVLVEVANLRGSLEFGPSRDGIEAA